MGPGYNSFLIVVLDLDIFDHRTPPKYSRCTWFDLLIEIRFVSDVFHKHSFMCKTQEYGAIVFIVGVTQITKSMVDVFETILKFEKNI